MRTSRALLRAAAGKAAGGGGVTYVAGSSAGGITNNWVSNPAGIKQGDLLIACCTALAGAFTQPSGWTALLSGGAGTGIMAVYYKIAGAAEPTQYGWQCSNGYNAMVILAYRGVDNITPIDASAGTSGSGAIASTPSITTTKGNDLILAFYCDNNQVRSFAAPAGFVARASRTYGSDEVYTFDAIFPSAGPTGAISSALSASDSWGAAAIALAAA